MPSSRSERSIQGETPHFDFVAGECARGIMDVGLATGIPIGFGVLTTQNLAQAEERADPKRGNKGYAAALAAAALLNVNSNMTASRISMSAFAPVEWDGDAVLYLDQRLLPHEVRHERAQTVDDIEMAIKSLAVRGAPCIGVFGAYGIALLRRTIGDDERFARAARRVRDARPTAVNLAWAVDRVLAAERSVEGSARDPRRAEWRSTTPSRATGSS